ncbi:MAG TPA: ABC transporter permease, partial [Agromyces sp.]|nr:ABC transporter permease [Agromyces sp.]
MWAVATLTFFAIRLIPGDPAQAILGGPGSQASQEALDQVRRDYGLDQPLIVQYLAMLGRLLTGDLGSSYALKVPVAELLGAQLGGTLLLAVLSLALAWVLALALSLWSTGRSRIATVLGEWIELTAAALPHFWFAAVLIAVFSTALGWFPPVATGTPAGLELPVVTLA